jgi:hypothetical protein
MGIAPLAWEIAALFEMDAARRKVAAEKAEADRTPQKEFRPFTGANDLKAFLVSKGARRVTRQES